MKNFLFAALAGLSLASCSEISTDPAPARVSRTAQTVTVTYSRSASTIVGDSVLQNPRLDVYLLQPTVNADGSLTYPNPATATPTATITDFSNPQPITLTTNQTVYDTTPNAAVRLVLSSTNKPGRRNNSQSLTASLLINGTSRATANFRGSSFARNAGPNGTINNVSVYQTALDANLAGYLY